MRLDKYLFIIFALLFLACQHDKKVEQTPWGTSLETNTDSISTDYTFNDILNNGEIIMLTLITAEVWEPSICFAKSLHRHLEYRSALKYVKIRQNLSIG